jgi:hypothetical protein
MEPSALGLSLQRRGSSLTLCVPNVPDRDVVTSHDHR